MVKKELTPRVLRLLSLGSPAEAVHVQCTVHDCALTTPSPTCVGRTILASDENRVLRAGFNRVGWDHATYYTNAFERVELHDWQHQSQQQTQQSQAIDLCGNKGLRSRGRHGRQRVVCLVLVI